MKKIFLLFFLLTISLGYSQGVAQAFETGGINGAPFASGAAPTVTREAGPGTNTTQVVKFVGNTGSQQWQGVNLSLTSNLNLTAATTRTMSIDVYASGPLFFLVKVNGGIAGAPEAAAVVSYTGTNTWQTCSFTFNSVRDGKAAAANGTYAGFVLHPYWPDAAATVFAGGNAAARTLYVDNITGPLALPSATVGAFTVPAKLVGDATFTITPPTSNNTSAFTYTSSNTAVGTIVNGNQIQVGSSGSSTITASQVSDGTYAATSSTATFNVTPPPPPSAPTPPARNSFDVVSLYSDSYTATSGATWQAGTDILTAVGNNARYFNGFTLARLAFAARSVSAMTTLHIDVYTVNQNQLWFEINGVRKVVSSIPLNGWASFDIPLTDYIGLNLGNVSFFDLNNPTGAANPVKVVYLDNIYFYRAATDAPPTIGALTVPSPKTVGDAPFTLTNPTSNSSGAWTYSSSPAGIVTFSGNTATIVSGGTTTITATQAGVPGVYGAGTATASLVVNFPAPGASPIPPVRDPASVVSLYTGTPTTYANVVNPVQASWSTGSTNSNFSFANGTNTCIQVNNLGFFGLVGASNFSVVGMSTMHVDIYVNTPMTTMILNLLAPSDRNYSIGPLVAGWNSFDIPLTTYPGALNNIAGVKFEQSGGTPRQIYIDNLYFYTGGAPTITNFPAIAKVNGDAPFNLTAPTSTSPGTFSYTSSNEAVATISGSTVTIVGQGTSTITANQAASGFFTTGSISATLTVAGSSVPLSGPTAPPVRNAWDVFSVFSDAAYTVVPGTRNYNPGWGQAGAGAVVLAGTDNVWRASNLNYQGIAFGSNVDVSAMTHFHVDVWTFNETSLQFFQISNTTGERSVALAAPYGALTQGQWVSYDIPLTAWTSQSGFTTTALKEFKIVGSGGKTVYMDNMYFYRAATTLPPTLGTFTVPSKVVGDAPFILTPPTSNSAGAFTYTSSNTAVATISGDTVTIVGSGSSTITATQVADGIYGTNNTTATLSVTPAEAPTPPVRNTWDVISFYSGAYTNTSPPNWAQGSDISISGNTTRLLSNYTLGTLNFASANVSAMTTLHLDIFSVNQNPTWIRINGQQQFVATTPVNGWTSLDIPLSSFTGANLSAVTSIVIFNPTGAEVPLKTAYIDNVYFYRAATDLPATIGALTITSPQVLGAASFVITDPTSNSSGAWSYSASPAGIVTFSGNTATIVGGGTATITATQAAVPGLYGPASTTASLVVTYPIPGPSPIPPALDPSRVVSMFTGTPSTYANPVGYNMVRAGWSGAALSTISNGSNTCLQVDNFGFLGYVTDAEPVRFSAAGMTNLHVDVYLNSPIANMFVFLLSNGDHNYNTGPLVAGWNSLNISLSNYPGANLASIYGFKFEHNQGAARQIYLDNIYFSNDFYVYYADADGDGFGDINTPSASISTGQPVGYVSNSNDCNDSNNLAYTGAVDVCYDGVDNDCDGTVDNNCTPIVSDVQPSQCGQTLAKIDDYVYAGLVSGAQGYRFKVTNVATGQVQTIDRFLRVFRITQLPNYAFNTEYSVEVAVRKFNVWQPYNGTPCTVKTPAATTQLINCGGASLTAMSDIIYANSVPYATGYQFKVTNVLDPLDTRTINRSLREFRMNLMTGIKFNTTYAVSVAVRNTDGVTYLPYGPDCEVITPSFPASNLIDSQCDDYLVPSNSTILYAESYSGAQGYRFLLENIGLGYDQAVDKQLRTIRLSDFPGLSPGSTYTVRVALKINGEWGSYTGKPCAIIVPGGARTIDKEETVAKGSFSVVAYPNPFATNFAINIQNASQEVVQVKVYDMLGRLIEQKESVASAMENTQFGNNYPAGVYTIIVKQGEITESLRMIKR